MRKLIFMALLALPAMAHAGNSDAGAALFAAKCTKCHRADYRASREAAVKEAAKPFVQRKEAAHGHNRTDLVESSLKLPNEALINWMTQSTHPNGNGSACSAVGLRSAEAADVMAFLIGHQTAAPASGGNKEGVQK